MKKFVIALAFIALLCVTSCNTIPVSTSTPVKQSTRIPTTHFYTSYPTIVQVTPTPKPAGKTINEIEKEYSEKTTKYLSKGIFPDKVQDEDDLFAFVKDFINQRYGADAQISEGWKPSSDFTWSHKDTTLFGVKASLSNWTLYDKGGFCPSFSMSFYNREEAELYMNYFAIAFSTILKIKEKSMTIKTIQGKPEDINWNGYVESTPDNQYIYINFFTKSGRAYRTEVRLYNYGVVPYLGYEGYYGYLEIGITYID